MTTNISDLVARLREPYRNAHDEDTMAEAADALQQQAERITAQDAKCRLYEAALEKADREIEGLRETINSPDAMASARAVNALLTAEIEGLKRDRDRAMQELRNIANADTVEWDDPSQYEAWAKSRARHTLAALSQSTETK